MNWSVKEYQKIQKGVEANALEILGAIADKKQKYGDGTIQTKNGILGIEVYAPREILSKTNKYYKIYKNV